MTSIAINDILDTIPKNLPRQPVTLRPPPLLWTVLNKLFGLKSRQYKRGIVSRSLPTFWDPRAWVWQHSDHHIFSMQMGAVQCPEDKFGSTGRWVELLFINGEAERLGVERDFHRYPNAPGGEVYESYRPTLHQSILSALRKPWATSARERAIFDLERVIREDNSDASFDDLERMVRDAIEEWDMQHPGAS